MVDQYIRPDEWQSVREGPIQDTKLKRLKVPGGWLTVIVDLGESAVLASTFIPDPEHDWGTDNANRRVAAKL